MLNKIQQKQIQQKHFLTPNFYKMTVKELIEELKLYSEDTRVFIGRMEEDDRGNYDYTEYELEEDDIKATGVYHGNCIVIS